MIFYLYDGIIIIAFIKNRFCPPQFYFSFFRLPLLVVDQSTRQETHLKEVLKKVLKEVVDCWFLLKYFLFRDSPLLLYLLQWFDFSQPLFVLPRTFKMYYMVSQNKFLKVFLFYWVRKWPILTLILSTFPDSKQKPCLKYKEIDRQVPFWLLVDNIMINEN